MRSCAQACGGFTEEPLLEDLKLVLRLQKVGLSSAVWLPQGLVRMLSSRMRMCHLTRSSVPRL
jgi:hypothetical protein